jgi:hypothetical protein
MDCAAIRVATLGDVLPDCCALAVKLPDSTLPLTSISIILSLNTSYSPFI